MKHRTLPFIALLAGGAAIGFAPIFVRWSDTGPVASAFWRLALAAPLLWGWAATYHRSSAASWSQHKTVMLAGLFFAGDLGVWHWSIVYTTVANATLLANFAPIFVTLGGWWLFRQRVSRAFLLAMTGALLGAVLLVGPSFNVDSTHVLGDALGVLTAVFYAGYMLAIKRARESASTVALMALSTTVSALALLPIALLSPQPVLPESAHGWWVLIGLAVVTQLLGQGLIVYAFAHLPATLSSVSLLVQPVVATALAWRLFGETLAWPQFVGGALVLAGIFLARRTG
jgi:drug/metabolite transporter (DMT)-like permease